MQPSIIAKWRPPLIMVLGGALVAVLGMPLAGVVALRFLQGPLGYRHAAFLVMAVVFLATLLLGFLLWRLLLNPITALAFTARAVQSGAQASAAAHPQYGTRELGDLGRSVLGMARSLQDREATIRSFADHVTHEMKTPLTAIRAASELLADSPLSAADAQLVGSIAASVARMQADLTALQSIAAARVPSHHGSCDLDQIAPILRADFPALAITIEGRNTVLPLAQSGILVVLGHLLRNAVEHDAEKLQIVVAPRAAEVTMTIHDNGTGISQGNRDRIFDPFFSTQRDAGGTGMGLAISQALLTAHGATITLLPTSATTFQVVFANRLSSGLI